MNQSEQSFTPSPIDYIVSHSKYYKVGLSKALNRYIIINIETGVEEDAYRLLPQALVATRELDKYLDDFYATYPKPSTVTTDNVVSIGSIHK